MKFIDKPHGIFFDRFTSVDESEGIDVIMMTLDAETFLEKSLYSIYEEIPVKRLIICDGGSKDSTIKILENYPRTEIHIKSEYKTGAKSLEFLISQVKSDWFVLIDSDIELSKGWYDEMCTGKENYDAIENGKVFLAYHKYKIDEEKLQEGSRAGTQCHLLKTKSLEKFHCDDDFMWRHTDFLMQQAIEQSGYKYGKINSVHHVHNETERIPYASDKTKAYRIIVIEEPKYIILDKRKAEQKDLDNARAIIKYLDPDFHLVKRYPGFDFVIRKLDRDWIKSTNPKWIKRYDKTKSLLSSVKFLIYKYVITKNRRIRDYAIKKYGGQ